MTKLPLHTPNKTDKNITAIAELFPNTLTEVVRDGKITHAIDFDMLKQELSGVLIEGAEERYTFNWPDKRQSILLANMPNFKTLRPCSEESVNFDTTENLYIEGDNIEVLKLLQETYLGKVKMIYIDPPYNTGKDAFVYDDNFSESIADYNEDSGDYDEDGYRLYQNLSTNGRFHTDWLNMIYPRLKVAKDLLRDDGVIFISIDDNEVHNLRKICDEVFGAWNFVCQLIWHSRQNKDNRNITGVSNDHEYIICYSKSTNQRVFKGSERKTDQYANPDNDPRGAWTSANMVGILSENLRPNCHYDLIHPKTSINYGKPKMGWRYDKNTMRNLIEDDRILWPSSPDGRPRRKVFLNELTDALPGFSSMVGDGIYTRTATKELETLLNARYFDYPKPNELIKEFVSQCTSTNDIILDFFSGSATTAHAVMQLNAENGGNRKFIMVQIPEECKPDSEASKAGYRTICEIGKERIRRAGKKINDAIDDGNRQLKLGEEPKKPVDIGFRVLKVDNTNMKDVYYEPEEFTQATLAGLIDNIKDDRTPEDLLFQVMIDLGVLLSCKIEKELVGGKDVFTVYNGGECYLIACFDTGLTAEVVTAIAKRKPYYAVFQDSGMGSDSLMTSFEQIFEAYSKSTVRRVL